MATPAGGRRSARPSCCPPHGIFPRTSEATWTPLWAQPRPSPVLDWRWAALICRADASSVLEPFLKAGRCGQLQQTAVSLPPHSARKLEYLIPWRRNALLAQLVGGRNTLLAQPERRRRCEEQACRQGPHCASCPPMRSCTWQR
eukprot:363205-Chlamydomonas_euryale.AAC.8